MTANCVGLNYNKQNLIGCAVQFFRMGEPSGMYLAPRLMEGRASLDFKDRGATVCGFKCSRSSFPNVFHLSCLMNFRDIYANLHAVASRRQGLGSLPRLNLMSLVPPPWPCAVARPRRGAVRFHGLSPSLGPSPCSAATPASRCPCDPPAGSIRCGQPQHRTELSCSQGKVLE